MDYKTFENHIKETFEFASGDTKSTFGKIDSVLRKMAPGERVYVGIKQFQVHQKANILHKLLSLDYLPPKDWREIADHLMMLKQYYRSDFDFFHPTIESYFDISLCKILRTIGSLSVIGRLNGNELARVKKLRESVRKKVGKKSTPVSQIFFTDIVNQGMNLHTVAKAIREEFIERKKRKEIDDKVKTPSIGMIKEYLKGDEEIMKYFKKKGKFWIVET